MFYGGNLQAKAMECLKNSQSFSGFAKQWLRLVVDSHAGFVHTLVPLNRG